MKSSDDNPSSPASSFEALLGALARAPERPVAPVAGADLSPGARVGRYEVLGLLGKGAMGAVYRARDQVLQRDVALKLLFVGALETTVDRFRREVVALASVSHENVVAVYDAGVDGGQPFVVLELVEGQTLRERLRGGALDPQDALRLTTQLVRGLCAAHAVGVVHRDLKPENVLIDVRGMAKIVDFGLARLIERSDAHDLGLTESGVVLGTAHYMAPEQVRGEEADQRADYFALGAVIYELLTGRRAFAAASRAEVITALLRDQPQAEPALLADACARRLLGVAYRCLEKQPERRFQSADELLDALERDSQLASAAHASIAAPIPETRYATSSGVHIAYQVVSPPGPPTLLAAPPFFSNIEVMWESPYERAWIGALAAFSHYIQYDRRGVGMSDRTEPECTIDERAEDLRAVLDAAGVERSFLLGLSEGGPISIAFAAKYPERVRGLVLVNSFARLVRGDGYERGSPRADYDGLIDKCVERWGSPKTLSVKMFAGSRAGDAEFLRWANRYERQCASPGTLRKLFEIQLEIDVRALLGCVRCPVLVMHRRDEPAVRVEHGRYLGEHLPGARYVELDGVDHIPSHGDSARVIELTRAFIDEVVRSEAERSPAHD